MSPDARPQRLSRILAGIALLCPVCLVAIVLLLRAGVFQFHDDFTGFKGLGFALGWAVVLLPAGTLAGAVAMWIDRGSWLARGAAALNALLLTGFLLLLARLLV